MRPSPNLSTACLSMRSRPLLSIVLIAAGFASNASGQAFNVDVGPNLILWPAPSTSYAAAAAQPGVWNAVKNPFAGDLLLTLSGAGSSVSLSSNISSSFSYPFGTFGADDDAFTSDGQAISVFGPAALWTFGGLADGQYDLYTYCWNPEGSGALSDVTVSGLPASTQTVGGTWSGSPHVLGVTYALHSVDVFGGVLNVEVSGNGMDSGSLLGFQLVPGSSLDTFCFGDGSGTICACGNIGAAGEGCANSAGSGATLSVSGSTSVSADNLQVHMAGAPAMTAALLFVGDTKLNGGNGDIFGDGLRCVGGPIQRLGVKLTAGGIADWGPGLAPFGGWSSGDTRYFQVWYRDSNGSPCGGVFNLTHGVGMTMTP